MNVSLTRELKALIEERVCSGRYGSASEVVREALRLLEDRERWRELRLEELRREIAVGEAQLGRGKSAVFDKSLLRNIKTRGRRRLKRRR